MSLLRVLHTCNIFFCPRHSPLRVWHQLLPQVGVLPIILVVLTAMSIFQYINWTIHHNSAVGWALMDPRIRNKAKVVFHSLCSY
jgi:hypothetical protein